LTVISEILWEALADIARYEHDPVFAACYAAPDVAAELRRCKRAMRRLLRLLDAPPRGPDHTVARERRTA
jgi:hypothetical protein